MGGCPPLQLLQLLAPGLRPPPTPPPALWHPGVLQGSEFGRTVFLLRIVCKNVINMTTTCTFFITTAIIATIKGVMAFSLKKKKSAYNHVY